MTEAGRRDSSSLGLRVLSAAVFIPVFVLLNRSGGLAYDLFFLAVVVVGLVEFFAIARARGARPHTVAGVVLGGLMMYAILGTSWPAGPLIPSFLLVLLMLELLRGKPEGALMNVGVTLLGIIYVAGLGSHFALLRQLGEGAVLFTFLVTWSGDSGAYFVGRPLGRHKLFPAISPAKSVEGAIGGVLASIGVALAIRAWILPEATPVEALVLGVLAGVIGPIGDLCESMLKRDSGVKDSARFIPGHGGILDRFDSLLFVAPIFYYYLKFMVFKG